MPAGPVGKSSHFFVWPAALLPISGRIGPDQCTRGEQGLAAWCEHQTFHGPLDRRSTLRSSSVMYGASDHTASTTCKSGGDEGHECALTHHPTLCDTSAAKNRALIASQGCIGIMEESFRAKVAELEELLRRQAHNDTEIGKLEYNVEDSKTLCRQKKSSLNVEQKKCESVRTQLQHKDKDCQKLRAELAKYKHQNMELAAQLTDTHTQFDALELHRQQEILDREKILAILLHKDMELFSRQEEEQTLKKEAEAHVQKGQKFHDKLARSFTKMVKNPPDEKISLLSSKGICKFYHDGSESDQSEEDHCADDSDDSSDEESRLPAAVSEPVLSPAAATEAISCSDAESVDSDDVTVLEHDSQQDLLSAFRDPKSSEPAVTESAVPSGGRVGSDAEKCLKQVTQFHDKLRRHYKFGESGHPLASRQLLTSQTEAIRSQINALKHDFERMWAAQKVNP